MAAAFYAGPVLRSRIFQQSSWNSSGGLGHGKLQITGAAEELKRCPKLFPCMSAANRHSFVRSHSHPEKEFLRVNKIKTEGKTTYERPRHPPGERGRRVQTLASKRSRLRAAAKPNTLSPLLTALLIKLGAAKPTVANRVSKSTLMDGLGIDC